MIGVADEEEEEDEEEVCAFVSIDWEVAIDSDGPCGGLVCEWDWGKERKEKKRKEKKSVTDFSSFIQYQLKHNTNRWSFNL